jgi:hypothetical protein
MECHSLPSVIRQEPLGWRTAFNLTNWVELPVQLGVR